MDTVTALPSAQYSVYNGQVGQRVVVKSWAVDVEQGALEQAFNLARLPIALDHVALMPDAHQGYGMPIGGVLFADKAVVPYAVGVDIGCGVVQVDLGPADAVDLYPEKILRFLEAANVLVPVGNGPQAEHTAASLPAGSLLPRLFVEPLDREPTIIARAAIESARNQLGTLGGGNHFLELQAGEDDHLYVMIHSGSRSVGKKICDHHVKVAKSLAKLWRLELPDPDLAWLPWETDEAQAYWADMTMALAWAEQSRAAMAAASIDAAEVVLGVSGSVVLDVHHNYAAWESHAGKNGVVHRKGAVRAREGDAVLIPGSMGTSSFVGVGLGSRDSFATCQHGAGRAMGRRAADRAITAEDLAEQLGDVVLVTPGDVRNEAPRAYKDVDAVMEASRDLVTATMRLTPLGVLKG